MWNDAKVIRAAENYVRVIVRRPHAYFFIEDQIRRRGGDPSTMNGDLSGVTLDGSSYPIPGAYILDESGESRAHVALADSDAAQLLVKALGREAGSTDAP